MPADNGNGNGNGTFLLVDPEPPPPDLTLGLVLHMTPETAGAIVRIAQEKTRQAEEVTRQEQEKTQQAAHAEAEAASLAAQAKSTHEIPSRQKTKQAAQETARVKIVAGCVVFFGVMVLYNPDLLGWPLAAIIGVLSTAATVPTVIDKVKRAKGE